mgnify:CR=1 FL=1
MSQVYLTILELLRYNSSIRLKIEENFMRKMKKLVRYLLLLAIPVAIAAALFVFNGSGYRLSEQDAADIAYKKCRCQNF